MEERYMLCYLYYNAVSLPAFIMTILNIFRSRRFREEIQMNQNFIGCVRLLIINGVDYSLNVLSSNKPDLVVTSSRITRCVAKNPCLPNPCRNGGGCSPLAGRYESICMYFDFK